MEQNFFQKFKRVKLQDLMHIILYVLAIPFGLILRLYRKNIWLLCDTRYEAGDNAFWLFQYIKLNEPSIEAVFALDKNSNDYEKVSQVGLVIPYGSFKHWVYYLAAERNISSQKMGKPNAAICYVLEVYGLLKNKRAFLQHGIITADLPFLHYPNTKMRLFVTSTQAEWEYVSRQFEYPKGFVQKLGLCRFDGLHDFTSNRKQLLIMPTWRMYIRNTLSKHNSSSFGDSFKETEYYKNWSRLLSDKGFLSFIAKNDITVLFYPHREMEAFLEYFSFCSDNIRLLSWKDCDIQTLLKESACLITDYSSVSMDFAYMKKPLIYFQFDYEDFRTGHHPEGYFSFVKDGFGPVCTTSEQVVHALIDSYDENDGFQNKDIYLSRHKSYFDLFDVNNCKRNFEAISKM